MSTNKISRRDLLKGLGITAAGGVLAACAPEVIVETVTVKETVMVEGTAEVVEVEKIVTVESIVEAPAAEPVVIRWWSYYEPTGRALLCPGMAKQFEDLNPGVTVELGHGLASYSEKLATAYSAGDPPELHGTTHTTMLIQVQDDALFALDDWYAESGVGERIHPGARAWNTVSGKLYGMSGWDLFCQEWYFNKAIFDNAGVAEPTSVAELYQACNDLEGFTDYPFLFPGMSTWMWPEILALIQAQVVGISLIEEGTAAKDYHIPELEQAVEIFGDLWANIVPDESFGLTTDDLITTFANSGVGIMSFHSAWLAGIKASVEEAGASVQLSSFADPILFVDEPKSPWPAGYGSIWAVPKNNKHLTEALGLLTYVCEEDTQRLVAEAGIGIPPFEATWDAITNPLYKGAIRHIGQATEESLFWVDFVHPQVIESLYTSLLAYVSGDGTPGGVLDEMTDAIQAI
jgi:raffinose/stachyose/melibiose transport system substrate-binding protein